MRTEDSLPSRPTPTPRAIARQSLTLRANLFGAPLGLAALAQCWSTSRLVLPGLPRWPVDLLWAITAAVWVVVAIGYLWNATTTGRLLSEPSDPTFGPFTALSVIVVMMLGPAPAEHAPASGRTLFLLGLVLTVGYGGWLSGQSIISDLRVEQWHPGYFLPTVAGGLVAAGAAPPSGISRWLG